MTESARVVVIGSNGQFGSIFARKFAAAGLAVHGVDRQPEATDASAVAGYTSASLPTVTSIAAALRAADLVVCCVPESVVVASLADLAASMRDDAVLMDITSVKGRIAEAVRVWPSGAPGYLSIHPMFGPTPDFADRGVCVIRLRDNARVDSIVGLMDAWGCRLAEMSAEAHDRTTALVQTMPHALLLAFGESLIGAGVPFEDLWAASTPVLRALLALVARVAGTDRTTYWSIQTANAAAEPARARLADHLRQLDERVARGDLAAFDDALDRTMAFLRPAEPELRAIGDAIVAGTRLRSRSD